MNLPLSHHAARGYVRDADHESAPEPVHGYRAGSGEPVLLLHKMASSWREWKPVLPVLAAERDVLAPCLPGHRDARPFPTRTPATVAAFGDQLERELDAAGWQRPHVVGFSFGGWLAFELARRGRARSVVALTPSGGWTPEEARAVERTSKRNYRMARATLPLARLAVRSRAGRRALLGADYARPERVDPADARAFLTAFARHPDLPATLDAIKGPRDAFPTVEGLDEVDCPVLLAWGTEDRRLPIHQARFFRDALPHADFVELPGVGHGPTSDDPEAVASLILDFTRRHAAVAATVG